METYRVDFTSDRPSFYVSARNLAHVFDTLSQKGYSDVKQVSWVHVKDVDSVPMVVRGPVVRCQWCGRFECYAVLCEDALWSYKESMKPRLLAYQDPDYHLLAED